MLLPKEFGGNQKILKLSDMIDEKFLNEVDRTENVAVNPQAKKVAIDTLITKLEANCEPLFRSHALKRQKSDSSAQPKLVIMSPILALTIYQVERLLSLDWKKRQVAACQLKKIFQSGQTFKYTLVASSSQKLELSSEFSLS